MTFTHRSTLALALLAVVPSAFAAAPWETTPLPGPMPPPAQQGFVEVDGCRLWWGSYGAGEPVVLLHGGAGNSDHWANQIPALAARHRVVVVDARGHGRSTRTAAPFTYHRMAEDVVAVLDAVGLARAAVVGWSDGGVVGLDLAVHHPARVARLFVFGANYDRTGARAGGGSHATFATYFDRCATDYRRQSPTPGDWQPLLTALRRMWRSEPAFTPEQLGRITAPTTCADGEHDEIIRAEHVREMARLIPGARAVFIPQASHFALWQRPDAFEAVLLDFLDGAPVGAPPPAPTAPAPPAP